MFATKESLSVGVDREGVVDRYHLSLSSVEFVWWVTRGVDTTLHLTRVHLVGYKRNLKACFCITTNNGQPKFRFFFFFFKFCDIIFFSKISQILAKLVEILLERKKKISQFFLVKKETNFVGKNKSLVCAKHEQKSSPLHHGLYLHGTTERNLSIDTKTSRPRTAKNIL
jgi:hypothetical protein